MAVGGLTRKLENFWKVETLLQLNYSYMEYPVGGKMQRTSRGSNLGTDLHSLSLGL